MKSVEIENYIMSTSWEHRTHDSHYTGSVVNRYTNGAPAQQVVRIQAKDVWNVLTQIRQPSGPVNHTLPLQKYFSLLVSSIDLTILQQVYVFHL